MSKGEITLEELRMMAGRAGLKLAEDELQRLLPGVNRSRKQVTDLRVLTEAQTEPAATFNPSGTIPN